MKRTQSQHLATRRPSRGIALLTAALLLGGGFAPILQADEMVPYRGSGWGYGYEWEVHPPSDGHPSTWYTGILLEEGEATHFGLYQARWDLIGDLTWEDGMWVIHFGGSYVQTAADGSSITASIVAQEIGVPDGPPFPFFGDLEVVSGTGRFDGASGSWQMIGHAHGDYDYITIGEISSIGSVKGD